MIHLAQLLCPSRHCVIAIAYEPEDFTEAQAKFAVKGIFAAAVKENGVNPWCGLCGSRALHVECAATRYATMAEAKPELERLEAAQAATRAAVNQN